jgi:hypothetical protein
MWDNGKTLDNGLKALRREQERYFEAAFTEIGERLLRDGRLSARYHNLTGNTLTSLAVGIYNKGRLVKMLTAVVTQGLRPATRKKLSRGDGVGVVLVRDYDTGRKVAVRRSGLQPTDEHYGLTTSMEFLKSYRPETSSWSLVVCTGTEYSTYLEAKKGLNVLSDTHSVAGGIARMVFKPIQR